MSSQAVHEAEVAGNDAQGASANDDPGLLASVGGVWGDVRSIASSHLQLAALEAQRAGQSLAWLLAYGILTGVLILGAWVSAVAALVLWLVAVGMAASGALLLASLLNIIAAGVVVMAMHRRTRDLGFPATMRSLDRTRTGAAVTRDS